MFAKSICLYLYFPDWSAYWLGSKARKCGGKWYSDSDRDAMKDLELIACLVAQFADCQQGLS